MAIRQLNQLHRAQKTLRKNIEDTLKAWMTELRILPLYPEFFEFKRSVVIDKNEVTGIIGIIWLSPRVIQFMHWKSDGEEMTVYKMHNLTLDTLIDIIEILANKSFELKSFQHFVEEYPQARHLNEYKYFTGSKSL